MTFVRIQLKEAVRQNRRKHLQKRSSKLWIVLISHQKTQYESFLKR